MNIRKSSLDKDLEKIVHVEAAARTTGNLALSHGLAAVFLGLSAILAAMQAGVNADAAIVVLAAIAVVAFAVVVVLVEDFFIVLVIDNGVEPRRVLGLGPMARHRHLRAFVFAFGHDLDGVEQSVASARPGANVNLLVDTTTIDPLSGTSGLTAVPVHVGPA